MDYFIYLLTAFSLSFFFGMWRVNTRKFSIAWFSAIHLPIPLIVWMRISFELHVLVIPIGISLGLVGQFVGANFYSSRFQNKSSL